MGGVTRRSLLASLMALSLLCGGLGVASAANSTVHVDESASGAAEVYTKTGVDTLLDGKADKTAVEKIENTVGGVDSGLVKKTNDNAIGIEVNKTNINTLKDTVGDDTKGLIKKTNDNAGAINNLQTDLSAKADVNTVNDISTRVDTLETTVGNATSGLVEDVNEAKTDITNIKNTIGDDTAGLIKKVNDKANASDVYSKTDAENKFADKTTTENELATKANQADLIAATGKITTAEDKITKLETKTGNLTNDGKSLTGMDAVSGTTVSGDTVNAGSLKVTGEISNGHGVTTTLEKINASMEKTNQNADKVADLEKKTSKIAYDAANDKTTINGVGISNTQVDMGGKDITNAGALTATGKVTGDGVDAGAGDITTMGAVNAGSLKVTGEISNGHGVTTTLEKINASMEKTNQNADKVADLEKKTSKIAYDAANDKTTINGVGISNTQVDMGGKDITNAGALTATGKVTGDGVDAGAGDITTMGAVNAGSLNVTDASHLKGDVTMDNKLSVTGDTSLGKTDVGGALNVTGKSDLKDNVILGTNAANTVTVNGTANFNAAVNMDKGLTVTNGETKLKKTTVDGDLKVTGTITTDKMVFGDKATQNYTEIDHGKVTSKNFEVRAGEAISSSSTFDVEKNEVGFGNGITDEQSSHKQTSDVITDTVKNNNTGDQSFHKQTSDVIMDNVKDGKNSNNRTQTKTETKDIITDENGNSSTTSQTASQNKTYLKDKDGKNTNSTIDTAKEYDKTIKGENGKTSTKQTATDITNTAEAGTIKNTAKNVTNEGTESVTNTVGGNEVKVSKDGVDIKAEAGKKITESVGTDTSRTMTDGRIIDKAGDMTVTTDKTTGTTFENGTPNDNNEINGGTIGTNKVNATETNTKKLTAGADDGANGGRLTVDADGVKGSYKSCNYTSKSYILENTLKSGVDNGKKPTDTDFVGSRTDHYMDGDKAKLDETVKDADGSNVTNKTSTGTATTITDGNGNISATIQNAKNLAGSVTNGTETGVSGIHANDDGSVSIDSAVAGGSSISTINQKKDSITSQVTDGTTITKTEQGTKDITNTATAGTITNDAKDIVNKAQDTITNTAGTSITNQVKDSKVTTDVDGTTFENKTAAVSDGGTTTTKINGNHINTGRVDANELGVSDKDDQGNTADFSVEAGKGVKASAGNGTTTGSLDVKADEVSSSVKDADGKGSTFKQRIDAIMMESKNVSIKAEETLTNEAKVITNKASEVINNEAININNTATGIIKSKASEIQNQADRLISNKVGENTWENMEDGKITTSIKNGTKQNLTQSDAEKTEHSVVNGSNSTVNKQTSEEITDAVTNGTTTNVTQNTATSSNNTIADKNGNANTVISTADGTSFINSKAAAPVTGASGDGTAKNTTIKGNTITTGKVTMDYADVMKDLGVRGSAKVDQNLEVGGTSTLKGDVTMESNAKVKKNLTVEGTTTTKTLKVTENAEIDGTLKVAKKATFDDSVSIAKDLSVGGDVTAKSYKVGDKTYIDANGIHANNQKITNVADGSISEGSKDAVNGGQLYNVKNDLEGKVNKVGANAAAMANLHPMEFDPDSKWNIAAAIGNYGSETAAALGAFYRPNDDVMVNLSTAFGTGENMVGGGVSVRLGKGGNKLSREESNALKDQVNDLTARMDALLSVLNPNMSKDFPDVPENHWAYEAVSRLAGNDIVQGYPDGEFHGERTMTRYEMAEIIYNALSRGAEAEKELVEEFKPELQAMAASEKATAERAEG